MAKSLKVGVSRGGGPPPGFKWSVSYLDLAGNEARDLLNEAQYAHVVDQLRSVASETTPTKPKTLDVRPIEDHHELRDKGGILGKINLRVYFTLDSGKQVILVLGVVKKEADGPTPNWIKIRMRGRLRHLRDLGWNV
jgi:hypothetical protein